MKIGSGRERFRARIAAGGDFHSHEDLYFYARGLRIHKFLTLRQLEKPANLELPLGRRTWNDEKKQ